MSYILDALKKSEKQRRKGAVPGVLTVQDAAVPEARGRMVWPYVVAAALLLNAGLFTWLLAPWREKSPATVGQPAIHEQANTVREAVPKTAKNEKKETRESGRTTARQVSASLNSPSPVATDDKPGTRNEGASIKPVPVDAAGQRGIPAPPPAQIPPAQPAAETKPLEAKIPPPENKIYSITELPASIQQGLPAFIISAHIYSTDPASRMVKINGRMMREGQDLAAGLKLEEISPNGVIFQYQNYRFRIGLK